MQESQSKTTKNEEIDLRELVRTVLKNKKIVIIAVLLSAASAAAYSELSPKNYQIGAAIEIGVMASECNGVSSQTIESPLQIKEKIEKDIYGAQVRKNIGGDAIKIYPFNTLGTNVIFLSASSANPDRAKAYMEEVCRIITEGHRQIADGEKQYFEDRMSRVREDLAKLKSGAVSLASSSGYYVRMSDLDKAEYCSQLALASMRYTRIIQPPYVAEQASLSPKLTIILAAVAGLFAGIFAVFATQWWRKS